MGYGQNGGTGFAEGDVITVTVTENTGGSFTFVQDYTTQTNLTENNPGSYTYAFSSATNDSVDVTARYQLSTDFILSISCVGP